MPYTVTPYPEFSWSESKARRWTECQRAHYWAVYRQHNGWLTDAEDSRREAWRLGKLVRGWPAALGVSLHARAAECIAACRSGVPMPAMVDLRRRCARELNAVYRASRWHLRDFMRAPKAWPVLASAYYGEAFDGEDLAAAVARLDAALDRLVDCALWPAIRAAAPDDVVVADAFHAFTLQLPYPSGRESVRVYAAPDVVFRRAPGAPTEVWDFKSGRSDGAVDQLLVYALAVRASPLFPRPVRTNSAGTLGGVIQLGAVPGAFDDAFEILPEDLEAATMRIASSVSAMSHPLSDANRNVPGPLEAFPQTERRHRCPGCLYRGLCYPDQYRPAAVTGGAAGATDAVGRARTRVEHIAGVETVP
jgi:PD-(D/E)XK nuclease superfamily protein